VTRLQNTCSSSSVLVVFVRLVKAVESSTVPPGPFTRGIEVTVQLKPISRPWWTYLRFSIRGLIVLVLLMGLGLGWMVRSAHTQRDAVAAIRKAGGLVKYDWEWSNGYDISGGKPWAPQWLLDLIGVDFFGHVTSVWLQPAPTDGAIAEVGRLTQLERLQLVGRFFSDGELSHLKGLTKLSNLCLSNVSDAGLARLKGLTKLKILIISGTQVTDAGLAHLKGLTNLKCLQLDGTQVTDAGLAHLEGLTKLTHLTLGATQVTDAGLAHLKGLTNLTLLFLLEDTQVSDAGLAHLKGLTRLSSLDLQGTHVTDAGLAHLKGLTKLSGLVLERAQITDAGLAHLNGLTKLRVIDLRGTQVTQSGVQELQKVLPNAQIHP
jgi:internalin A